MKAIPLIFILALLCVACASQKEIEQQSDMIEINLGTETIELAIGEKVSYTGTVHGSVGIQKECKSDDESVIKLIDKKFKYIQEPKEGETGGDRAKETYIFEGIAEGKATITIEDWYRGELESSRTVQVLVKD